MRNKKRGVLVKILLLFSFTVLPLSIIGAVGLWTVNYTSERTLLRSVSDSVDIFAGTLDNQLRQTYDLAGNTVTLLVTKQLSNPRLIMTMYNRVVAINLLRDMLTNIKVSDSTLANVRVYLPKQGIIYNSAGYLLGSQQEMTDSDYILLDDLQASQERLHFRNNRIFMLRFSELYDPDIVSEIEFNHDWLDRLLKSSFLSEESTYILVFHDHKIFGGAGGFDMVTNVLDISVDIGVEDNFRVYHQGVQYRVFRAEMPFMNGEYYQIIPNEHFFRPMQLSALYTIIFITILVVCVIIFFLGAYRLIHNPLKKLVTAFDEISNKNFNIRVASPDTADFDYLYDSFNNMAERLDELIQQDYRLSILLQNAELKQLQAQINPHFLYNSFFILNQMIFRKKHKESMEVSKMLGEYFRYITKNDTDVVSLKEEYEHAKIYADIQNMRFSGRIHVDINELPIDYESIKVPKLMLQPILENAFNYAMEDKIKDGLVRMSIIETADGLDIITEDNGETLTPDKIDQLNEALERMSHSFDSVEKTGLINISKRLELFFKKYKMLKIYRSPLGGMAVLINLPNKEGMNAPFIDS